ncbi:phosphoesterase [Streptomyces phage Comrade]|uniref:Phosphoesterase n=1 Tax=Streptomyces phage Comrade TaxID=2301714 RepID=A0A385DVI6_9CAUD|nr:phosphoesterase [Streptomyces phage Comrade]AXQ63466.1 phosphoesterase [Streptomyces phage Comrade]
MTVFFTSDTHFGHQRIIELCERPFDSVDEMNEAMIERWNAVVKPTDVVYHLGDVALGKIAESLPLVGRLNGDIALVPGNHDRIFSGEKEKMRVRFDAEYRKVFASILPESLVTSVGGFDVVLSHFPYVGDSHGADRHADKRPKDEGLPIIHGHVHDEWKHNGRMFNVGVDVNDFRPVHMDEVVDWLRSL